MDENMKGQNQKSESEYLLHCLFGTGKATLLPTQGESPDNEFPTSEHPENKREEDISNENGEECNIRRINASLERHHQNRYESSPGSPPLDMDMPILEAQCQVDEDQSCPYTPRLDTMPVLNSSDQGPAVPLSSHTVRAPSLQEFQPERTLSEDHKIKTSLSVIVDQDGVIGKSPENMSESSPSTPDYVLDGMESSPEDCERQPCDQKSLVLCKGQVLNGENSPGFSLRESCDISSLEGESSRPMLSPQQPGSVNSEGVNMHVTDILGGDQTFSDLDSPPVLESPSPRPLPNLSSPPENRPVDDTPVVNFQNVEGESFGVTTVCPDSGEQADPPASLHVADSSNESLPKLIPLYPLDSSTAAALDGALSLEPSSMEGLPQLTPEKSPLLVLESLNSSPVAQPASPASVSSDKPADPTTESPEDVGSKPMCKELERESQTPALSHDTPLCYSPMKTRNGRGKKRKSYTQFYDESEDSDCSDDSFHPNSAPRRKRRRRISARKPRKADLCLACLGSHPAQPCQWVKSINEDNEAFIEENVLLHRLETQILQILKILVPDLGDVSPGSVQFYETVKLCLGSMEFPVTFRSLSLEGSIEKGAPQKQIPHSREEPVVLLSGNSAWRFKELQKVLYNFLEYSPTKQMSKMRRWFESCSLQETVDTLDFLEEKCWM